MPRSWGGGGLTKFLKWVTNNGSAVVVNKWGVLTPLESSGYMYWGWENFHGEPIFFFVFLSIWKFSWPVLSYLDYPFDLPNYISDSTKRYTLLLSIYLGAREERFGSYSARTEMTYLWRLPGMTGGRMKWCKNYFSHWNPFFKEMAWWVKATLTLTIF